MEREHLQIFKLDTDKPLSLSVREGVPAGFPSPATDYIGDMIDLNEELIFAEGNTYFAWIKDYCISEEELEEGDAILIDTTLPPRNNDLAVCCIDGEMKLKYIRRTRAGIFLRDGADSYETRVESDNDAYVWGIVTFIFKVRRYKGRRKRKEFEVLENVRETQQLKRIGHKRALTWSKRGNEFDDDTTRMQTIDLEKALKVHPLYSEYGKISGLSLKDDDINDGDSVIIEKGLSPMDGDLALSYNENGFTLKYICKDKSGVSLIPANGDFPPIRITGDNVLLIWGIITVSIKQLRYKK